MLPKYGTFQAVYDALQLQNCNTSLSDGKLHNFRGYHYGSSFSEDGIEIFVDVKNGNDSNNGDIAHPLQSIKAAIELSRIEKGDASVSIYLREGTYFLPNTLELNAVDSRG